MSTHPLGQAASASASALQIEDVSKSFGETTVVKSISINVAAGTVLSLLGPSGCGKTTILRMIAGFISPTSGRIRIAGEDVTGIPPHRRKLGMVFQSYSLFPHMNVAANVAFGLKMQGALRAQMDVAVTKALAMVQMAGMEERFPSQLSGGQQQRVALARAVVTQPKLLLLDEPFGALDRKLREEMQIEVKELQRELGLTVVFVTHDQDEALTLSHRIAIMRDGRIEQLGSPTEIFQRPATQFAAEFFGSLNSLPVRIIGRESESFLVEWKGHEFRVVGHCGSTDEAVFSVRVIDAKVQRAPPEADTASLEGILEDMIYKGSTVLCRVKLADGTIFMSTADPAVLGALRPGAAIHVAWRPEKAFLFPRVTATDNRSVDETRHEL